MNYVSFIVKIIEKPILTFFDNNIPVVEIRVKFPQTQKKKFKSIIRICIWNNLASDITKYYQINDYIIIEGYISLRTNSTNLSEELIYVNDKQVIISVIKIYPFLLKNIKIDNIN